LLWWPVWSYYTGHMSTTQIWQTDSIGWNGTVELGRQIGHQLKGGEVVELISDLGGGKTTFVRGMTQGMGSPDAVHSPSFTLHNQYRSDGLTLHHFDFYRLFKPGELRDELTEVLQDQQAVVVVEWGHIIQNILPEDHLRIEIHATGDQTRRFGFSYPERLKYLLLANT
jgi:tRNA threonylcarbamoyladenosine biosynthesis protein TsaE